MIYHHGHILVLAKRAYDRSLTEETESFVSITLSAMALECYVNDFSHQSENGVLTHGEKNLKDLNYVLASLERSRATLISKIEAIHHFMDRRLDKSESLYQQLTMLVRLRNELVHRKPEPTELAENTGGFAPNKYVKFFADRGVIQLPTDNSHSAWSQYLNNPSVARWAYNTAVHTIKGIVNSLPASHFSHAQHLMNDRYEPI